MAELFIKQAKAYSEARPTYPQELFDFIASKTPEHHLVWDVGTGNGQAAKSIYKNVIATDTSPKQLELAPILPNIQYRCTPANMTMAELEHNIAPESMIDLVTIATALHRFDLSIFYHHVNHILKKPNGVIAAWCYTVSEVNDSVDSVFMPFDKDSKPYWGKARELVDDKYRNIDFPFQPVDGLDNTGPFEFKTERLMKLEDYFTYIRSWSAYTTAQEKGVELLNDDVVKDFTRAWKEDGKDEKIVKYPVYLRIGKVGNQSVTGS